MKTESSHLLNVMLWKIFRSNNPRIHHCFINLTLSVSSDLFEKMVPMAVQQSMSIYSQRKTETVNRLVGTMREATNLCNGYADMFLRVFITQWQLWTWMD